MWTIFKVFIEFVTTLLLFYVLVFWLRGMWDLNFPTRDWTHTPCSGRWSLNQWTSRKIPTAFFFILTIAILYLLCSLWKNLFGNAAIKINAMIICTVGFLLLFKKHPCFMTWCTHLLNYWHKHKQCWGWEVEGQGLTNRAGWTDCRAWNPTWGW